MIVNCARSYDEVIRDFLAVLTYKEHTADLIIFILYIAPYFYDVFKKIGMVTFKAIWIFIMGDLWGK